MTHDVPKPTDKDKGRCLTDDYHRMMTDRYMHVYAWEERGVNCLHGIVHPCVDGWPSAIRRALYAEARVRELEAELKRIKGVDHDA